MSWGHICLPFPWVLRHTECLEYQVVCISENRISRLRFLFWLMFLRIYMWYWIQWPSYKPNDFYLMHFFSNCLLRWIIHHIWLLQMWTATAGVQFIKRHLNTKHLIKVSITKRTVAKLLQHSNGMMTSLNGNIFRVTGSLCGEFTGPGEFPTQRPVTRSFDVFFDLRLNKRLSKPLWGWWFETPSWSL